MRGVYVDLNVTGPNQFTPALQVEPGQTAAVSAVPVGFAGVVTLQRSLDGVNFWDVQSWADSGVQGSYDPEVTQLLRMGVKSGQFSLGAVYLRIEK